MTEKEFKAFVNENYDFYEAGGFTLGQVARDIERRIRHAEHKCLKPMSFRHDVSAHVSPGNESRLYATVGEEFVDIQLHFNNCSAPASELFHSILSLFEEGGIRFGKVGAVFI